MDGTNDGRARGRFPRDVTGLAWTVGEAGLRALAAAAGSAVLDLADVRQDGRRAAWARLVRRVEDVRRQAAWQGERAAVTLRLLDAGKFTYPEVAAQLAADDAEGAARAALRADVLELAAEALQDGGLDGDCRQCGNRPATGEDRLCSGCAGEAERAHFRGEL